MERRSICFDEVRFLGNQIKRCAVGLAGTLGPAMMVWKTKRARFLE
jgi:hypothetical protein